MRLFACTVSLFLCLAATATAQEEWPQDALDVSYTVAARIAHMPTPKNITFDQGVEAYMEGVADGRFAAFQNGGAVPVHYQNYGTGLSYAAEVIGVLHLLAPQGRIVTMQYLAQYTVNRQTIRITQCMAATTSPSKLTLEVYMIPASLFRNSLAPAQRADWGSVYDFAKSHAYNPQKDQSQKDTYLVMTFVKNRLPRDAAFEVIVSDREKADRELDNIVKDKQAYLNYDGWRVHMFSATFLPTSLRERFYSNYYYTPGLGFIDSMHKRKRAARFNSHPSATGPSAPMQTSAPQNEPARPRMTRTGQKAAPAPVNVQTAAPSSGDGPIARGQIFLNPLFSEDTAMIQTRLRKLGYYSGPIDQSFGPMTQKALDAFAVRNRFPKGQWSLALQKALFRDSGK